MFSVSYIVFLLSIFINFDQFSIVFTQPPYCTQDTVIPNPNAGNAISSLTSIFTNNNNNNQNGRLTLGVCMELMCPYTRKWFLKQWCPIMNQMLPCVDIKYIISGNVMPGDQCQHGPKECALNSDARDCGYVLQNSTNNQSMIGCYLCCAFGIDAQNIGFEQISQQCCSQCNIDYNAVVQLRGTPLSAELWNSCRSFTDTIQNYLGTPCLGACNGETFDTSMTDDLQGNLQSTLCQMLGDNSQCCSNSNLLGSLGNLGIN